MQCYLLLWGQSESLVAIYLNKCEVKVLEGATDFFVNIERCIDIILPMFPTSIRIKITIITSLAKEIMFLVALVCLFVCLFVCLSVDNITPKVTPKVMKFYGEVLDSTLKTWLNFGGDLGILRWVNEQKSTITVVAYPDHGASNDPKPLGLAFITKAQHYYFGKYGSNDLPPPRRSALSECF